MDQIISTIPGFAQKSVKYFISEEILTLNGIECHFAAHISRQFKVKNVLIWTLTWLSTPSTKSNISVFDL